MQEPGTQPEVSPQPSTSWQPPSYSTPIPTPSGELNSWAAGGGTNDSGTGPTAVLPIELHGMNWGAFLLNWIWAIAHNSWWGLLCLVPYVNFIMVFVMLVKGNEWAWQNRKWESVQQFRETQAVWTKWGIGLFILGFVFAFLVVILLVMVGLSVQPTTPAPAPM